MASPAVVQMPSAGDSRERHADWLELRALEVDDRNSSLQDLVAGLRRTGSIDALDDPERQGYRADSGSEITQPIADDAFAELDDRSRSCGNSRYPYEVSAHGYVQLRAGGEQSLYIFLLLLWHFGKDAGPKSARPVEIFEDLSAIAAESYLGGSERGARAHRFGFPRSNMPRGFAAALRQICADMGEGSLNTARPGLSNQKDSKLDVVAWKAFSDRRRGKLVAFGQCATGDNWRTKVGELRPSSFIWKWMNDGPPVDPVRLFFVADRIGSAEWPSVASDAGIIFDRCRIVEHADAAPAALLRDAVRWSNHVVARVRR